MYIEYFRLIRFSDDNNNINKKKQNTFFMICNI